MICCVLFVLFACLCVCYFFGGRGVMSCVCSLGDVCLFACRCVLISFCLVDLLFALLFLLCVCCLCVFVFVLF